MVKSSQAQAKHKKKKPNNFRHYFSAILLLFLLIAIISAWLYLRNSKHFPIKSVRIEAPFVHTNQVVLEGQLKPYTTNGFFSINVDKLRKMLLRDPWIANVSIRRVFPKSLIIQISEQQAIARWGDNAILNANGKIFTPPINTIPTNLPMLYGPQDEIDQVWSMYQNINKKLVPLNLKITELGLNARHAWRMVLNTGTQVVLGRMNVDKRIARFVTIYPKIIAGKPAPKSIDLRYNNGLAINFGK